MSIESTPLKPRPELDPLPRLMQHLPRDPDRHYPVPWFVEWIQGKPEFRASSQAKVLRAIKYRLCWVCGTGLPTRFCYVAGPMCGINRTSSEPASHIECGRWSAKNCPFLTTPTMVRRQDAVMNNEALRESAPGMAITRNPGVTMVWITREYELFPDGRGGFLIHMGRPQEVEWYCQGRSATFIEVMDSIESGIGALEAMARQQEGGMEDLLRKRKQFERWLPGR